MNRIMAIEIKNFQSHQDTRLELADGLNVITGASDQGKSAIIRALRWVLYSQPLGSDFIKVGTNNCQVTVELDNGYQITRRRTPSGSKNGYVIVDPEGNQQILEKIGRGVPDQVLKLHGMPKIKLDESTETTLNLDYQLDGPFLLNESGSDQARIIGRLLNVHLVDSAIGDTNKDKRNLGIEVNRLSKEIEEQEEELKEFDYLDELEKEIKEEEGLLEELKKSKNRLEEVSLLQKQLLKIEKEENKLKLLLNKLSSLDEASNLLPILKKEDEDLAIIKELSKKNKETERNIKIGEKYLKLFLGLEEAETLSLELNSKREKLMGLNRLLVNYKRWNKSLKKTEDELEITSGVEDGKKVIKNLAQLEKRLKGLKEVANKLLKVDHRLESNQRIANSFSITKVNDSLKNSKKDYKRLNDLKDLSKRKEKFEREIEQQNKELKASDGQCKELAKKYSELLKRVGKCPTCLSEVDDVVIEGIISKYSVQCTIDSELFCYEGFENP